MPEYIRPLFCEGRGPFVGLRFRQSEDIRKTDNLALELFPDDQVLSRWLKLARERVSIPGLPRELLARLWRAGGVR